MITDVPTYEDFSRQAYYFLNLAWDSAMNVSEIIRESQKPGHQVDDQHSDEIRIASNRPLLIAQALAQQGAEIALKAKIAEVSPYLLLTLNSNNWKRSSKNQSTLFADFRTIDAQDLPMAHDTICEAALKSDFCKMFDRYRKERNAIFHTVDQRLSTSTHDVIVYILNISQILNPIKWPLKRSEYLNELPSAVAFGNKYITDGLLSEMAFVMELLTCDELMEFFGYNKSSPSYLCPRCYRNCDDPFSDELIPTAQFESESDESTRLHCFVCRETVSVVRQHCMDSECKGNIHWIDDVFNRGKICLTCYNGSL